MNRNRIAGGTRIRAKRPKIKEEDLVRCYQDLLEIARLVSWCMNRDHLIKTCLDPISQRLGKRARGIETIDRMSDRQITAKVRRYFQENRDEKGQL